MTIKTNIKAGGGCSASNCGTNHNQTQIRDRSLRVKTSVRAGGIPLNHNESQAQDRSAA